jgi:hypothetical protein
MREKFELTKRGYALLKSEFSTDELDSLKKELTVNLEENFHRRILNSLSGLHGHHRGLRSLSCGRIYNQNDSQLFRI